MGEREVLKIISAKQLVFNCFLWPRELFLLNRFGDNPYLRQIGITLLGGHAPFIQKEGRPECPKKNF
jgi:hypothetical protein